MESEVSSSETSQTMGTSGQSDLAKYFTRTAEAVIKDTAGQSFFDTISIADGCDVQPGRSTSDMEQTPTSTSVTDGDAGRMNVVQASETPQSRAEVDPQPSLVKFFAEESGCNDLGGKAFFDALANLAPTESKCLVRGTSPNAPDQGFLASAGDSMDIPEWIYDVWIPPDNTAKVLQAVALSPPGTFFPEKDQLTMPGIILEEELIDPVLAALQKTSEEEAKKRVTWTADKVSQDVKGLQHLIAVNCFHAAINLSKRLLTELGQGVGMLGHPSKHTPFSLQLWYTRFALLIKLRRFTEAEAEFSAFGNLDKADLFYEFYPDTHPGRKGSLVPFSMRLLAAQLPNFLNRYQEALNRLYGVLDVVHKIIVNFENGCLHDGSVVSASVENNMAALKIWRKREFQVLVSIFNCALSQKDYPVAFKVGKQLQSKNSKQAPAICSALGRVYLQLGDVQSAGKCFDEAEALIGSDAASSKSSEVNILINRALMAIADNNYTTAYNYYKKAYSIQPTKSILINNMAVCLLYMGKLQESLSILENAIVTQPSSFHHEGVLFNTSTLYELESSKSEEKKEKLFALVSQHVGDNFPLNSLKIQLENRMSKS